jgi:ubiquinone biosynthesis protein COQ9
MKSVSNLGRDGLARRDWAAQLSAMDGLSPLEQLRRKLALAVGENAVFDGWTSKAVSSAALQLGIDPVQARLAMPKSQSGLIDCYIQEVDRALEAWFTTERLHGLKIREKIRQLVWRRLEIMTPAREAVRRALAILAMPQNLPLALGISWRTADLMWRIAGDTSTDFNHYTKRMTLGAVYGSTLLAWLDDRSEGWSDTAAFLDRRIDDVMRFEKWKAGWSGPSDRRPSLSRFLGRLRYPPR